MTKRMVTVLPGEGIGPEVMNATLRLLEAMDVPLEYEIIQPLGQDGVLNPAVIESLERNLVALKAATRSEGHRSFNVQLRERFGLFANIRPIYSVPGINTRFSDVKINMVVFRENLEGLYVGRERLTDEGAEAILVATHRGSSNIAWAAFEYARNNKRKRITCVTKKNILPLTHEQVFFNNVKIVAGMFPYIDFDHLHADAFAEKVVQHPERFDVILTTNEFGDILSDLGAGLVGGIGVAAGINVGHEVAVAETVGGTADDIAGQGIANPSAMMLTAAMLLEHVGSESLAVCLRSAIFEVLKHRLAVTRDIDPVDYVSTEAFADAVIAAL